MTSGASSFPISTAPPAPGRQAALNRRACATAFPKRITHSGDGAPGERNPAVRLTTEIVAEIRARWKPGVGNGIALAREFGISNTQLHDIVHHNCWSEEGNAKRRERRRLAKALARGTTGEREGVPA